MAAFAAEVKLEMRDRTKGRRVPAPHYTTMQKNMTLESALGVLWRTRRAKIVAKVTVCAAELRVGMLRRDPGEKILLSRVRNTRSYPRHEQNYGLKTGVM